MTLCVHSADPSPLFEAAFRRIERERMADVPVLNPALAVEAVGLARWQDHWLGVLITPWFMNLVLAPGDANSWRSVRDGERLFRRFPAGDYAFLGGHEPELGEFQTCALFSPMGQFPDQDGARAVALAALEALLRAPEKAAAAGAAADRSEQAAPKRAMSKREFLGAAFRRG